MIKVELSIQEIRVALTVGVERQIEDIEKKKQSFKGESQAMAWQRHIEGALAECALAKYLGIYWSKRPHNEPDVGDVDVRTTHWMSGNLRMDDKDKDDRKYYLLTGLNGEYIVRGWLYGRDGKKQEYWGTKDPSRPPCYWIPQSDLNHDEK